MLAVCDVIHALFQHYSSYTEVMNIYNRAGRGNYLKRALDACRILSVGAFAVVLLGGVPLPVSAHNGVDHDAGAKHAADDLVGTPLSEVEKKTNENKQRITQETGVEPGAARSTAKSGSQPTLRAVAADPSLSGVWSAVMDTPLVPVYQAVLPNGKVLMWDSVGENPTETYPNHTFTRAMVWDPVTNIHKRVDVQGYNIFCAGFAHLPNGNVLVAGGTANAALEGIVQTHIFNWQTETWSRGANMESGRWYPSVTSMANGEQVIVGGGPAKTEIFQSNNALRGLPGFTNTAYGGRFYPFMISRPDGLLGLFGPYNASHAVITAGDGATAATGALDGRYREYGTFATYDIGKTLVAGGGDMTEDGVTRRPTKTAITLNSNTGLLPQVTATGSMSIGRRQANATVLADGSVVVTGGVTSNVRSGSVDLNNAVTSAERWDPATGAWSVLSSAARIRQYHSTAALLPDGRVLTGGGGICAECLRDGYLERNIEYFTPPYLYKKDGSGQLAARPVIATAPGTVPINAPFAVMTPQAASIRKVALVGLGDVTHSVDQGQRYVPLQFTTAGTTLTVTGSPNSGVTPPGYYMLFIIDADGVPSVAKMVQVSKGPNPLMSQVKQSSTPRCIDVPNSNIASGTYLQAYPCNNTKAQSLIRLPNDNSLRIMGNCVDVPNSNFRAGQRIWAYTCNNTTAQKWRFDADGSIRSFGDTGLCLVPQVGTGNTVIQMERCNGSAAQRWVY
jgi:hypothetical protein